MKNDPHSVVVPSLFFEPQAAPRRWPCKPVPAGDQVGLKESCWPFLTNSSKCSGMSERLPGDSPSSKTPNCRCRSYERPKPVRDSPGTVQGSGESQMDQCGWAQIAMPPRFMEMLQKYEDRTAEERFAGGKTAAYRQLGNAFSPPVAAAVARSVRRKRCP